MFMLSFTITINVIENHFVDFALLIYYIRNLVEVKSNSLFSRKRCEDYHWLWKPNTARYLMAIFIALKEIKILQLIYWIW